MTTKAILEAALKLPTKSRVRLASKLLDSVDEPVWSKVVLDGAKQAERRLRILRNNESAAIPADEAHARLFGKHK
jgi:hypothetical protein